MIRYGSRFDTFKYIKFEEKDPEAGWMMGGERLDTSSEMPIPAPGYPIWVG